MQQVAWCQKTTTPTFIPFENKETLIVHYATSRISDDTT